MNYVEEQRNELEALSEIYYNEIKIISDKPPISFSIKIRPQPSTYEATEANDDQDEGSDSDDDSTESAPDPAEQSSSIELQFNLPTNYPEEKPSIQILDSNNIDEDDLNKLLEDIDRKADESIGTVMIFTLVSDIVEWLIMRSEDEVDEIDEDKAQQQRELEAIEKKRFEGTSVTEQTFLAWKAKFDAEMLKIKLEEQKRQVDSSAANSKRLTGREMFESDKTLAESDLNFVEDLEQDQIAALLQNIDDIALESQDFDVDDEEEDFDLGDSEDDDDSEDDEESTEGNLTSKRGGTSKR